MKFPHLLLTALLVSSSAAVPLPLVFGCRQVRSASLAIYSRKAERHGLRLLPIISWCEELNLDSFPADRPRESTMRLDFSTRLDATNNEVSLNAEHPTPSVHHLQPFSSRPHLPPSPRRERERQLKLHHQEHPSQGAAESRLLTASDAHHFTAPLPLHRQLIPDIAHPARFPPQGIKPITVPHPPATTRTRPTYRQPTKARLTTNLPYTLTYTNFPAQPYPYNTTDLARGHAHTHSFTSHKSFVQRAEASIHAFFTAWVAPLVNSISADALVLGCLLLLTAIVLWDVATECVERWPWLVCRGQGQEDQAGYVNGDRDEDDKRGPEPVYEMDAQLWCCGRGVRLDGDEKKLLAYTYTA